MRPIIVVLAIGIAGCADETEPGANNKEGIIAVAQWDDNFKAHIFTMAGDGKNKKQLTSGQTEYWMPSFSPDGKKIAYVSRLSNKMDIYMMDAAGSNQQSLTSSGINMAPSWSPDGTRIAYAHGEPEGEVLNLNLWTMNADGTDKNALTTSLQEDNNVPTWSADGKKIAFTSNRNVGRYQIWTLDLTNSRLTQLTTAYFNSTIGEWIEQKVPAWSPDGKHIAFWEGVEGSNSNTNAPWNICVMNPDGTHKKTLSRGDDPAWSPDSKTIVHPWKTTCPSSVSIGRISPDGTNQRLMFISNCGYGRMSWSLKL